jgi:transposase
VAGTILEIEREQKKRRRSTNYPLEFMRRLALQACDETVSVAQLALQHGLNTNTLFRWSRQLRAGLHEKATQLLPVTMASVPEGMGGIDKGGLGRIEIQSGEAKVRIHGAPDPATLALVLQGLHP